MADPSLPPPLQDGLSESQQQQQPPSLNGLDLEDSSSSASPLPPPPSTLSKRPTRAPPALPSMLDSSLVDTGPNPSTPSPTTSTSSKPARSRPPIPTSSLLHPATSSLPSHNSANAHVLTPLRSHYLKKFLVNHQFMDELAVMSSSALGVDGIASLGPPFKPPQEQIPGAEEGKTRSKPLPDLPFLKFMFRQFVLTFPFLASAPPSFWPLKVQPTLSQFLSLSLAPSAIPFLDDDPALASDAAKRRKIFDKLEKHMTLLLGSAIKLEGGEEVVRIGQEDLRLLEEDAKRRVGNKAMNNGEEDGTFAIDVIGVRGVAEKGRVRSRSHEEFLVRTTRLGVPDVFVWRRYGDFKRLSEELRIMFPDENIRSPPAKDKTATSAPTAPVQSTRSYLYSFIPGTGSGTSTPVRSSFDTPPPNSDPSTYDPSSPNFDPTLPRTGTADSSFSTNQPPPNLSREKNRLTLRSFLRSLLTSPNIANSPILRSFLLSGPQTLSAGETTDAKQRENADRVREEGRKRFKREAERRVEDLRGSIREMREEMIARGGIRGVFEVVKKTSKVEDLPEGYKKVLEYGRISMAATVFQTFVASDDASTTLLQLKRLHGLMPYFVLKGILRVSNPMAMIRGVLELFLARPFGGQSLVQRMFSTTLNEDIREIQEQIEIISEKIGDPDFCEKVKMFVIAPLEIQQIFKADAEAEGIDIIAVILRSPDAPALARPQMLRVIRAHRAYAEYKKEKDDLEDSDDDDGPEKEEGWLFIDLNHLMKLYARLREKERMVALIFEGATAELLKDIITIFYAPLAQVYKAASIADSLSDLQNFINDLIRTCDQVEELSQEDPQRTVQTFIDLVNRHEQSFYTFVHKVHSKGSNLFSSLMSWIELFLDFVRDGLPPTSAGGPFKLDLEFILPHSGPERIALLKEVDAIAVYHYKLKVAHEGKTRRKFLREGGAKGVDNDDDEQALVDSIVDGLSFGNTMRGDAAEIADEESSSGEEESDASEEESDEEYGTPEGSERGSIRSTTGRNEQHPSSTPQPLPSPRDTLPTEPTTTTSSGSPTKKKHHLSHVHRPHRHGEKDRQEPSSPSSSSAPWADAHLPPPAAAGAPRHLPGHPPTSGGLYEKKEQGRHAKKKGKVTIDPPVIRHLPTLVPLFVEMVRPLLVVSTLDGPENSS